MTTDCLPDRTLDEAIKSFLASSETMVFVQVGGFDGVSFDPLRPHILSGRMSGIIVEPLPNYFEKLQGLYAGSETIKVCNCAIDDKDGERVIWRFQPAAIENGLLGTPFAGISSFVMDDLLKEDGTLGGMFNAELRGVLKALIEPVPVRCRTFASVLAEHDVKRVDLLQIDTEGYDLNILRMFDFERHQPAIVHFEHQHLSPEDRAAAEGMLRAMGYRIHHAIYDTLAIRSSLLMLPPDPVTDKALASARALYDRGMADEVLAVCDYILAVDGGNAKALHLSAAALDAAGRPDEVLRRLVRLRDTGQAFDPALPAIGVLARSAVDAFNAGIERGDLEGSMALIEDLVALFPHHQAFLNQALSGSVLLERKEQAASYAERLLALDPSHVIARQTLIQHCRTLRDYAREAEHRIEFSRVLSTVDVPESVKLDNIFQALGGTLCAPPTDERIAVAEELLARGRSSEPDEATRNDASLLAHHTFYRVSLDTIDLTAAFAPSPPPRPWAPLFFASASGRSMTPEQVKELAAREKARAVFLLSADEVFVARYARASISSILRMADVPCLVIVFAAVPAGRLPELGASVGIDDERVVFCGDGFVPSMDEYHSFNQQGYSENPNVYYQCMRYLWSGWILEELRLPMFVCDIDIIMQRGVGDLLARCADTDVTLNRSSYIPRVSSHIIANLVLLNPTETAMRFNRFLRDYLERALHRDRIPAFLDQLSLLIAWHHLQRALSGRVSYFDEYDINNVMFTKDNFDQYASLAEQYRFINLYASQGEASLDPAMPGENVKNPVAGEISPAHDRADPVTAMAMEPTA